MATISVRDDAIWLNHIEGGAELRERLGRLAPGAVVDLEVDGVVGQWERMRDGRDGRPTLGLKPIAEMRRIWARWRQEPTRLVPIREVTTADSYLAALETTLDEWSSPEDEFAYRDL